MTFKQSILELQHCNKCNSDVFLHFLLKKVAPKFGGNKIITYLCSRII